MAKELLILTTGGTFDKMYPEGQWVQEFTFPPSQQSAAIEILRRARMAPDSYEHGWVFAEDSTRITDAQREIIADRCAQAAQTQIVVTHGTDTMTRRIDPATGRVSAQPCTAQVIAGRNLAKTIVLTGAAQPAAMRDSDTDFNLGLAVGAALTAAPGTYVAMNGLVLPWDRCVKDVDGRFRKLEPADHANSG
ncbi:MAG TPA: asparaginase domain-containing protein [Pseudolabrys sp.]|nr:asparaginase domain-containing protein [Pseudolabrys sp.]